MVIILKIPVFGVFLAFSGNFGSHKYLNSYLKFPIFQFSFFVLACTLLHLGWDDFVFIDKPPRKG